MPVMFIIAAEEVLAVLDGMMAGKDLPKGRFIIQVVPDIFV